MASIDLFLAGRWDIWSRLLWWNVLVSWALIGVDNAGKLQTLLKGERTRAEPSQNYHSNEEGGHEINRLRPSAVNVIDLSLVSLSLSKRSTDKITLHNTEHHCYPPYA